MKYGQIPLELFGDQFLKVTSLSVNLAASFYRTMSRTKVQCGRCCCTISTHFYYFYCTFCSDFFSICYYKILFYVFMSTPVNGSLAPDLMAFK